MSQIGASVRCQECKKPAALSVTVAVESCNPLLCNNNRWDGVKEGATAQILYMVALPLPFPLFHFFFCLQKSKIFIKKENGTTKYSITYTILQDIEFSAGQSIHNFVEFILKDVDRYCEILKSTSINIWFISNYIYSCFDCILSLMCY